MGLSEQAAIDAQQFLENTDDFGIEIILTSPTFEIANVTGYSRKHHTSVDPANGHAISTKQASVTISEKTITDANPNYPVRINDPENKNYQEVSMIGHLIDVPDSSGIVKNYKVLNHFPDEKLGWIVFILEDYKSA
jgi:hypothetical protein